MFDVFLVAEHHRCGAFLNATLNERVSVHSCTYLGNEEVTCTDLTAVKMQAVNLFVCRTNDFNRFNH